MRLKLDQAPAARFIFQTRCQQSRQQNFPTPARMIPARSCRSRIRRPRAWPSSSRKTDDCAMICAISSRLWPVLPGCCCRIIVGSTAAVRVSEISRQPEIMHPAHVVHPPLALALGDFDAQVRQQNVGAVPSKRGSACGTDPSVRTSRRRCGRCRRGGRAVWVSRSRKVRAALAKHGVERKEAYFFRVCHVLHHRAQPLTRRQAKVRPPPPLRCGQCN